MTLVRYWIVVSKGQDGSVSYLGEKHRQGEWHWMWRPRETQATRFEDRQKALEMAKDVRRRRKAPARVEAIT